MIGNQFGYSFPVLTQRYCGLANVISGELSVSLLTLVGVSSLITISSESEISFASSIHFLLDSNLEHHNSSCLLKPALQLEDGGM